MRRLVPQVLTANVGISLMDVSNPVFGHSPALDRRRLDYKELYRVF